MARSRPPAGGHARHQPQGPSHAHSHAPERSPLLLLAQVVVVHQVAEGLGGDGHHVGKDDPAVTAAREDELVVRVVVSDAPHPVGGQGGRVPPACLSLGGSQQGQAHGTALKPES